MNDDQIQKILDKGGSLPENSNTAAYRTLYEYLDNPDGYTPPAGFAHRVAAAADQKEKESNSLSLLMSIAAVAFLMVIAVIGMMMYYGFTLPINRMTINLMVMFSLGLILTGFYRIIEKRYLTH